MEEKDKKILLDELLGTNETAFTEMDFEEIVKRYSDNSKLSENEINEQILSVFEKVILIRWDEELNQTDTISETFNESKVRIMNIMNHKYSNTMTLLRSFLQHTSELVGRIASDMNDKYKDSSDDNLRKTLVMFSIHRKAVQIANEMLCLIENGYSSGAEARWRTLYEFAVVIKVLNLEEVDTDTIEGFIEHYKVSNEQIVRFAKDNKERLNLERNPELEYPQAKKELDEVLEKYGKDFKRNYGWFKPKPQINLSDLAKRVGLNHMQYRVKQIHQLNHASSAYMAGDKGDEEAMNVYGETFVRSHLAMEMPIQNIPFTLNLITTELLLSLEEFISIKTSIHLGVLTHYNNKIQELYFNEENEFKEKMNLQKTSFEREN